MSAKRLKGPPLTPAEAIARKRTGLAWACPGNVIAGIHGDMGSVAVMIKTDKNGGFYFRCPACGTQIFFSREFWTEAHGLTPDDARRAGMVVIG